MPAPSTLVPCRMLGSAADAEDVVQETYVRRYTMPDGAGREAGQPDEEGHLMADQVGQPPAEQQRSALP